VRIIIACEESQVVCNEFRKRGHEAYSCDIINCSGGHPEWHIKDDVLNHLDDGWDMMIAHPVCKYLANSGVKHLHIDIKRWPKLFEAAIFFNKLKNANIKKKCIENPIPHKYAVQLIGGKYDQLVQPWQFGHLESKATCFWLEGLGKLKHTNNVREEMLKLPKSEQNRVHYMSPGKDRERLRSVFYSGIARAMADQWGLT